MQGEQSYAHGGEPAPLLELTIGEALAATAARHGERDALVSCRQGVRLTYRELAAEVERCSRALLALGVARGDRVGCWSPNVAEWIIVQYATARIGAILVNVNPSYRRSELEYALAHSGCSVLIHAESFKGIGYRSMLDQIAAPALRHRIELGDEWHAFLAGAEAVPIEELHERESELSCDQPINIQYTSGTTGSPKGATLSHRNILNNGHLVGKMLALSEADRICVPVPFYHCFGMVLGNLAALAHGSCIVIPSEAFEPRAVLEAVESERCTALYGVPTMFIGVLADPARATADVSSLRTGIMAGSPCPIEVMKQVRSELGMEEVTIAYGMTETAPASTQTARDDPIEKRVGTVGRVLPHTEVKIVDPETGQTVPRGTPGELCTRGYLVMLEYWQSPDATSAAVDAEGYMHTGDLATMDAEGYVNIVGRSKDVVIRGGENISPREVEEFLYRHPAIKDVQVFGVPDERVGEEVAAWIVLREGMQLDADGVRAFCDGEIARFKIPRYVRFVDSFPLTVTGKVQKFKMREHEASERGLVQVETA